MTVIEDYEEAITKRYPIVFKGYKNLGEVHDWLWQHYQGYHFCILLNETKDEYEPFGKELRVYFSDEAMEEIAIYAGCEVHKKW